MTPLMHTRTAMDIEHANSKTIHLCLVTPDDDSQLMLQLWRSQIIEHHTTAWLSSPGAIGGLPPVPVQAMTH